MVKCCLDVTYAYQDKHDYLVSFGPEYDQTHGHEADKHAQAFRKYACIFSH